MHALLAAVLLLATSTEGPRQRADHRAAAGQPARPGAGLARTSQKAARDPRTAGLGKSCKKNRDCKHGTQKCIQQSDAQGKAIPGRSFCVLPCASFESGMEKVVPGAPAESRKKTKKPPPRCPPPYECRSAGAGVPIDICVRQ